MKKPITLQKLYSVANLDIGRISAALAVSLLVLTIFGIPARAQAVAAAGIADYEAKGYVLIDPLNILLLQSKAENIMDTTSLLQGMGTSLLGPSLSRFERYLQATGTVERFEMQQSVEQDIRDRAAALSGAKGYILPLATTLGGFDPGLNLLSMRLTLDLNGLSGSRSHQCATARREAAAPLVACISVTNLEGQDPIFSHMPFPNAQAADLLASLIKQGRLGLYAQAEPDGPYQRGISLPGNPALGSVAGNQPTHISALLLIDNSTGRVVNSGKASDPAKPAQPQPRNGDGSVQEPGPAFPESTVALPGEADPRLPDGPKAPSSPGSQGNEVRYGPPGEAQTFELDRFLSLLSYTVYASPEGIKAAKWDLKNLQAKFERISQDGARVDVIQQKELQKLAAKIEGKTRKLELLQSMLELKQSIPARFGAKLVAAPRLARISYERYRLRDGREVTVFRGTDGLEDLETDFQLAMTPDAISEIAAGAGRGQSILQGVANLMRNKADTTETTGKPEAFKSADSLVASMVRSGVRSSDIILTGHSLGGGLAQYAGLKHRVGSIVTFNTAPLNAQLREDIGKEIGAYEGELRHYVSFVPGPPGSGKGTMDPVSQRFADVAGMPELSSLQVIGPKPYVIEVCNDLDSSEYQSFHNTAQGFITKGTVIAMASGRSSWMLAGHGGGAAVGARHASTDQVSSIMAGSKLGGNGAKALAVGANCLKHPFLCSAKAAAGGAVSAYASASLPGIWAMYTAHRMKNIFDALNGGSPRTCGSPTVN